jgi:ATP-dependent DNA helicase RecQ
LLVDEYQDINGDHYELISALAGRTLDSKEDKLSLLAVGDDDQNIYAFGGANVCFIRQFETDYNARRYHLIENYRSTAHIIDCANELISHARDERVKKNQVTRINHARRDQPAGGEYASIDPVTAGRVHILEVHGNPNIAAQAALAELERLNTSSRQGTGALGQWGQFAVIARYWANLEPMAALCRLRGIPVRQLRDEYIPNLHITREGDQLLSLLREEFRQARRRVLLRSGTLSRWFRRRFGMTVDSLIEHPQRALLAQFIVESESIAPGSEQVVQDLIESIYEFGSGGRVVSGNQANGPMVLMTAHRAKGLEFDHVLILDGGGWSDASDEERRLFYVAMTRARKTLTLCESARERHAFVHELDRLALRSQPAGFVPDPRLARQTWVADPKQIVLSWPGYFSATAPIHKAIAVLDVGDSLELRPRSDGKPGWEVADSNKVAVTRMAQDFIPPPGKIIEVRVSSILARKATQDNAGQNLRCKSWELILPEIEFLP